jgi:hypothetical protein
MGAKLSEYYRKVEQIGGIKARLRLAVITRVSSDKAANEPDSPEHLKTFEAAFKEIEKEFK